MIKRNMRTFALHRTQDVSGVSGIGIVAEGVEFSDGIVIIKWLSSQPTETRLPCRKTLENIHGHGTNTTIVWDDEIEKVHDFKE